MPSIKVLNISIVLLCILTTAFVCTFLAISSSEKALDNTKESRDVSVAAAFSVGEESVTNRTEEYLSLLAVSTIDVLTEFMKHHRQQATMIADEIMAEPWDTVKQWAWHHIARYFNAFNLLRRDGNTGVGVILTNRLAALYLESHLTIERGPDEYHQLIVDYNHGDDHPWGGWGRTIRASVDSRGYPRGIANPMTDVNWNVSSSDECAGSDAATDGATPDTPCNSTEYIDFTRHEILTFGTILPKGATLCGPPISVATWYVGITCSKAIYHDAQYRGIAGSGLDIRHFSTYLSTIKIGGPVAGRPSRGRVYVTMRDNWFPIKSMFQKGIMLGASHGSSTRRLPDESLVALYPHESTDPIISRLANKTRADLYVDELAFSKNVTILNIETDLAPQGEDFYYRVEHMADDHGVDWHVHLVIDREYILGTIDRRTAETRDDIKASEEKVDEDLETARVILYVVVVAVAVSLTLLSVVFVHLIIKPLSGLMEEMVWVSEMDLDRAGSVELSSMVEVREMQVSFRKMKQNLKDFKAYVPVALLNSSNTLVLVEPPSGNVALVFTDIVQSTELWGRAPTAMNEGLEIHNDIIRAAAADHSGYEVKTIGDAFMVAFDRPHDAISFCLKVLTRLAGAEWPTDLGLDSQGMRVRIGCHVGHTLPEENPLTGRRDYRGSAVNLAARSEGRALPGTVCVSSEVMRSLDMAALGGPKVEDIGMQMLKGIEGQQHMYLLVPAQLGDRVSNGLHRVREAAATRVVIHVPAKSGGSVASASEDGMISGSQRRASVDQTLTGALVVKKTGLTLVKGNATVAVCIMVGARKEGEMFDDCNAMVRAAVEAASQTDGVVGTVTGQTLTVVWNASKQCKLHTTSAMRFAAQLEVRAATIVRVGLATGQLLYGNVGTQRQRFNTAFGRPLEAAHAGAALANHCSTFAILVDVTQNTGAGVSPAVAPFVRCVDVWEDESGAWTMTVHELLCKKLMRQLEDAWGTVLESDPELEEYNEAYKKALRGEVGAWEKLRLVAALGGSDAVTQHVVAGLEGLTPDAKRTSRVTVRFGHLPQGVATRGAQL